MPRRNVTGLKAERKRRRPRHAGSRSIVYNRASAIAEDIRRVGALKRQTASYTAQAKITGRKRDKKRASKSQALAAKLQNVCPSHATPASAVFLYELREPLLDQLTRLARANANQQVFTAALIPSNSRISADGLKQQDATLWMKRLRNDLDRAGGSKASGWLAGQLHGEYDPENDEYGIHYHIAFTGDMWAVIERLRAKGKYQLARLTDKPHANRATPIQVKSVNLDELRYALSYVFQSWWPKRGWYRAADGDLKRSQRMRIPEPRHTEWLHWMDRQTFQGMTLLYHLEVRANGLLVDTTQNLSVNRSGR